LPGDIRPANRNERHDIEGGMMAAQPPLPVLDDADSAGFFEAAGRGELVIRRCVDCAHVVHLPAQACDACHSWRTDWRVVRPTGRIHSYSHVERQVHPAFPVPYTVVLVSLDEAPDARFVGWIDGVPDVSIGMAVEGRFEQVGDTALLRWDPLPPGVSSHSEDV